MSPASVFHGIVPCVALLYCRNSIQHFFVSPTREASKIYFITFKLYVMKMILTSLFMFAAITVFAQDTTKV
jgi:hypothetical protein